MKRIAEDANPLTGLPGNNVIRGEVEGRISKKQKFVTIHSDLDNFKAYNDKYGIAKGDEIIKLTSEILKNAVRENGNNTDFVGHSGGDDFFLVTTPDKAEAVTGKIISDFDTKIKNFYSKEDQKTKYILEKFVHQF